MNVEQYVMAYGVEQDKLRAILPDGFVSLRPVLRINAEIRDGLEGYIEFNTAIKAKEFKGWLNIGCWSGVPFETMGKTVRFKTSFLDISFTGVGVEGGCPAEKDNDGCWFLAEKAEIRQPELILENKEFCDCEFSWSFERKDAHGISIGKTLPAILQKTERIYEKQAFTAINAAAIPCEQVLGSYRVGFRR